MGICALVLHFALVIGGHRTESFGYNVPPFQIRIWSTVKTRHKDIGWSSFEIRIFEVVL
jgi:hypothetical protein